MSKPVKEIHSKKGFLILFCDHYSESEEDPFLMILSPDPNSTNYFELEGKEATEFFNRLNTLDQVNLDNELVKILEENN